MSVLERVRPVEAPVPPPAIYVAGFAVGAALQRVVDVPLPWPALVGGLGLLAAVVGLVFIGSAVATLGRTSGLATRGVFTLTRNPIYVGFAFAYLGVAALLRLSWAILLLPVVIAAVDQLVVAREERRLSGVFGDDYRRYIADTPRWLFAHWRAS
jgi:protein-S-isoprenylcysteine O-methyltransferase Ste14